jgi:outer membrane protein
MTGFILRAAAALAIALGGAQTAAAQTAVDLAVETEDIAALDPARPAARFTFGAGAAYGPDYPGSDDYSFGPSGVLRFDYIRLPGGIEFGGVGAVGFTRGFGPVGATRYIGSRKASDNPELRGLDDVDAALEIGLGVGYEEQYWRAFADARYGVIGHHSWVGEFGADAILRPNDSWVLNFGPRANWGSSRFMNTYFGVSEREADRSNFRAFDPSSGFYSAGVEFGARYSFSERWGVEGEASYERLINDASDSPITDVGSQNQYGLQVVITRSLSLGF